MNIHYLQHESFEGLGYIETWLREHHHTVTATKFFASGYTIPNHNNIDALIIMGGTMSANDDAIVPWMRAEKEFIRNCISSGKKVLGICLGAQLMATCLGAHVDKAPNKEIGWYPVKPTAECKQVSWLYTLFKPSPMVFHWHEDKFEIPQGCLNLLSSDANTNQGFWFDRNTIGLQFHLEATPSTVEQMFTDGTRLTKAPFVQTADEITAGSHHTVDTNRLMGEILKGWLEA